MVHSDVSMTKPFWKFFGSGESPKPKPNPKPPPKHSDQLSDDFNNLTLNNRPSYNSPPQNRPPPAPPRPPPRQSYDHGHRQSESSFVGGFIPPPLTRPPAMPQPQHAMSMTMQQALRPADQTPAPSGLNVPHTPPHAHSAPEVHQLNIPNPTFYSPSPHAVSVAQASTSTPPKPGRKRASSTPADPSAPPENQCSGVTKAGKRCSRQVKNGGPAYPGVERFCFQHVKDLMVPTGFYGCPKGKDIQEWIEFADYIPSYLHQDTQVALRVEMVKARSPSDVEGYIYTFEIRDPDNKNTIQLKVGRTTNVVKRLNEWGKQCGSKEQVLRGWFPGSVEDDHSLMKGRVILPEGGNENVWCHRLERLIHLELADLAVNGAYLEPGWRAFTKGKGNGRYNQPTGTVSTSAAPKKRAGGGVGNGGSGQACKDCDTLHKEIFEFRRPQSGRYKGREWDGIVKKVIEDWGAFVTLYV